MPKLPTHPFIVPDGPEDTRYLIDGVLGIVQQCILAEINGSSTVADHARTLTGLLTILDGVRSATEYLSYMDPPPSNVAKAALHHVASELDFYVKKTTDPAIISQLGGDD